MCPISRVLLILWLDGNNTIFLIEIKFNKKNLIFKKQTKKYQFEAPLIIKFNPTNIYRNLLWILKSVTHIRE